MEHTKQTIQFVRVENEKLYGFQKKKNLHILPDGSTPQPELSSLKELGLYMMLSAFLSNPSFSSASGGMQKLLLSHCKNRYFSLHGAWKNLMKKGFLHRTRIPEGLNRFTDYYDLFHTPEITGEKASFSTSCVSNLTVSEGASYLSSVHTAFCPPETDYTMVSYPMLMDSRLSLSAKGLYAILARQLRVSGVCSDVVISKTQLRLLSGEGCNAFDGLFRELRTAGYLTLERSWDSLRNKICYRYCLHPAGTEQTVSVGTHENTAHDSRKTNGRKSAFCLMEKQTQSSEKTPISVSPCSVSASVDFSKKVREQIEYDILCADYPKERLDSIVSIMIQYLRSADEKPNQTVSVGANTLSVSEVADRFRLLDSEDIRFVLNSYHQTVLTTKIFHVRRYLTSCLFYAKENLRLALDAFRSNLSSVPCPTS